MASVDFDKIKTLTIIALVSDDELMDTLVLKGGNALRLIYGTAIRQSLDLDFSLDGDFGDLDAVRTKITGLLESTFHPQGLTVFGVKLLSAPPGVMDDAVGEFWGGYTLEFKVIETKEFVKLGGNIEKCNRQAMELGVGGRRAFSVDFSKHEYCHGKERRLVEGFRVYIYSPLMIACEKIRAICQQMESYREIVKSSSRRPRARDFFDVHGLVTKCGVNLSDDEAWTTLRSIFGVKHVPLRLLGQISDEREFHRENFESVKATVHRSVTMHDFDFYVDFLVDRLRPFESRWKVNPPV